MSFRQIQTARDKGIFIINELVTNLLSYEGADGALHLLQELNGQGYEYYHCLRICN